MLVTTRKKCKMQSDIYRWSEKRVVEIVLEGKSCKSELDNLRERAAVRPNGSSSQHGSSATNSLLG